MLLYWDWKCWFLVWYWCKWWFCYWIVKDYVDLCCRLFERMGKIVVLFLVCWLVLIMWFMICSWKGFCCSGIDCCLLCWYCFGGGIWFLICCWDFWCFVSWIVNSIGCYWLLIFVFYCWVLWWDCGFCLYIVLLCLLCWIVWYCFECV